MASFPSSPGILRSNAPPCISCPPSRSLVVAARHSGQVPPTGRSRAAFPDPPSTDHVPSPAGLPLRCRDSVILTLPGQLLESSPFAVDQTLARRVLFAFCLEHHKQSRGRIRSTVGRPRPVRVQSRAEFATKPDRLFSLDFHTWQTHAHLAPVLTQWIPCFISYRQDSALDRPTDRAAPPRM